MKKEVGIVICACRKHCNLKQDYMARKFEITFHTYANFETGRVDLNTEKLFIIAKLLGIKPYQIFDLAEEIVEFREYDWLSSTVKRMIRII